jgi:hypothetical protein
MKKNTKMLALEEYTIFVKFPTISKEDEDTIKKQKGGLNTALFNHLGHLLHPSFEKGTS